MGLSLQRQPIWEASSCSVHSAQRLTFLAWFRFSRSVRLYLVPEIRKKFEESW
uniref:Uncharacterized protein n=1 Tax=Oryza sativa subsp. japonica TaxID=39947 RepID=Q6K692_ORYSJ|nr:hypothetical protein [Oryza sativa Japonica Group]BAD19650.1 hypothetical protein [Oryza sativa Japonica Group]